MFDVVFPNADSPVFNRQFDFLSFVGRRRC
jgi:hypothetical protein